MKKQIAFFDFDGTITNKDTLIEFIKFSKGDLLFYIGFILSSPYLIAYKLRIISNQRAKEKVLRFFFSNTSITRFQQQCEEFAIKAVPRLLRPKAYEEIQQLQKQGTDIVVVSASPENWIRPWCELMQLQLIATRLEVKDNRLTGNIFQCNCHGEEKVSRIRELFILEDYENVLAYGDTAGDRPMLKLANTSFYKPFR